MWLILIFFYIFIVIVAIKRKKHSGTFLLLCFFLFFIAAFRNGDTVKDYTNYINMYNIIDQLNFFNVEPTFIFITKIVKLLFNQPLFLFIIYALLGVALKCKAIKDLSDFRFLSLLIYISNFFLLQEMTQIRVGVAAGFMLMAIKPVFERDLKQFFCYALLAFLFHYSAILVFGFWFLPIHNINRRFYALLIPVAYLLYCCNISLTSLVELIPIPVLQNKIHVYKILMKQENLPINVFNVLQLMRCGLAFIFLWKLPLLTQCNRYVPILLQCYVWAIVFLVIFSDLPVFAFRISEIIGCVEIILVPCIYYIFKQKQVAVATISALGFGVLLLNLFYNKLIII